MVRYAINMAVDKQGLAKVLGSGRLPARGFVPPMQGYPNPERVEVEIGGRIYNVLEHNPEAARALLAASRYGGSRRLKLRYLSASLPLSAIISLFLRQQLEEALGAELAIDIRELNAANRTALELSYEGLTDGGDWGTYVDPSFFLDRYVTGSGNNTTGWEDPLYDALIADANSTLDAPGRLRKQAECEKYALAAMPNVPLWYNTWSCLQKPFVHGLPFNLLDLKLFKYAWIDSNWRAK
jgi:oligopeptide transport system substrate-binding protein